MDPILTLRFTPNKQDYTSVLRAFFWRHARTRLILAAMGVAFLAALAYLLTRPTSPTLFEVLWVLLPLGVIAYIIILQPSLTARQAAENEQLSTEVTWLVSEAGLQVSTRFGRREWRWEQFSRQVTTRGHFLLLEKENKNWFRFVPRRAFRSAQEERKFLGLVRRNVISN